MLDSAIKKKIKLNHIEAIIKTTIFKQDMCYIKNKKLKMIIITFIDITAFTTYCRNYNYNNYYSQYDKLQLWILVVNKSCNPGCNPKCP